MPTAYKVVSAEYESRLTCTHGTVLQYPIGERVGPAPDPGLNAYEQLGWAVGRWARMPGFDERPRVIELEYEEADVLRRSNTRSRKLKLRYAHVVREVPTDEVMSVLEGINPRRAGWCRDELAA